MQNLSKIVISNNNTNDAHIKNIFDKEGIVVINNFFEHERIIKISDEIFSLINKIKIDNENKIESKQYKVISSAKTELSYQDKVSSDVSIVEFREDEDSGMIDIFNFDKSFELGKVLKKNFLDQNLKSKLEKILLNQIEFQNFNIYYNKNITKTRNYHVDSYNENRYKVFVYLTNCEDYKYGPFCYILGSHKKNYYKFFNKFYNKIFKKKLTDMKFYDKSQETAILGKSGTLLISNQNGMHKGYPQSDGAERLIGVFNFKIKDN
jgi:hypothetical protein